MIDGTTDTTTPRPSSGTAPGQQPRTTPIVQILDWLDGRKTYLVAVAAAIYLIGGDIGWWPQNDQVLTLLGFGGLAALRAGMSKRPTP